MVAAAAWGRNTRGSVCSTAAMHVGLCAVRLQCTWVCMQHGCNGRGSVCDMGALHVGLHATWMHACVRCHGVRPVRMCGSMFHGE